MNIPVKFLFICTHNRCRSILSEAIMNNLSTGTVIAKSAGSTPSGQVHPLSIQFLAESGISTDGLASQSWDEFESYDPDVVVTVCDSAAAEACPVWLGNNVKIHWGLSDPSKVTGSDEEVAAAFRATISEIDKRTKKILALPLADLDVESLEAELNRLTKA